MATYNLTRADDAIIGTANADTFNGNLLGRIGGTDTLDGGGGNDKFLLGEYGQGDQVHTDGGDGDDTIVLYKRYDPEKYIFAANIENLELSTISIRTTSGFLSSFKNIYSTYGMIDGKIPPAYDKMVIDLIGDGEDLDLSLKVTNGQNADINGSYSRIGLDIIATAQGDNIRGSGLNDIIDGFDGDDIIYFSGGRDILNGGSGNDTFSTASGYSRGSVVDGGVGVDTFLATDAYIPEFSVKNIEVLLAKGSVTTTAEFLLSFDFVNMDELYDLQLVGAGGILDFSKIGTEGRGGIDVWAANATSGVELIGTSQFDRITGTKFADILRGGGGLDALYGGDGSDILIGGVGPDYFDGGLGSDTVSYADASGGVVAGFGDQDDFGGTTGDSHYSVENLIGSSFNDRLYGSDEANTILGNSGNDVIEGLGGSDKLFGEAGDDTLNGSAGTDYLSGGTGLDTASYAHATAAVKVNLADPSLNTGEAKGDTFASIENLEGWAFNDTLDGNAGANTLTGLGGIDVLRGAAGNDVLRGGDGDDKLGGGDANDSLSGGAGADYLSGGTGTDTASYADAKAGVTASLVAPAGNAGEAAGDTFSSIENLVGSNLDDMLTGNSVANRIDGGQGNDTIRGHNGNDVLTGGDGHDKLNGGTGADSLEGGSGTDTASYADASDGIIASLANASINTGEAEGDTYSSIENLTGSAHDDVLNGDNNANAIIGDAGNDAVKGYAGDDKLFGGDGNDTLNGGAGADYLSGGAGSDAASYAQATSTVKVNLADPSLNAGEASGDTFNSIENLEGSNFDDTLDGNSAANSLSGSIGNDILRGAAGNDTLQGGTGDDTLGGGDGNDILLGGAGADYLSGGLGIDGASYADAASGVRVNLADSSLNTGAARGDTYNSVENLLGSAMNDSLEGNATNNRIDGGDGDDLLNGGSGSDRLVGGNGIDTATYITAAAGLTVSLANSSVNTGEAAGDIYQSIEKLTGSKFDDLLTGDDNASGNRVYGATGDDVIDGGGGGSDRLEGGSGNDFFIARSGEEYFDGGTGHDTLSFETASSGIFIESNNNGGFAKGDYFTNIEIIIGTDFADTVHFGGSSGPSRSPSAYAGKGDDVLIGGDNGMSLYGEDGDDTLIGGARGDKLFGGSGIDTASYSNATAGVLASLANNSINKGDALGDVYSSIENLVGSDFDDRLYGNNATNTIVGGGGHDAFKGYNGDDVLIGEAGDDILNGGLGIDKLDGGGGLDSASYADATAGVYAALYSPSLNKGDAADDIYISIEGLVGSQYNDTLIGDSATNKIEGMSGNDVLIGEAGNDILNGGLGVDKLDGGAGLDTASYADASAGVYAALYSPSLNQGEAADDTYISIEGLIGTRYNDTLIGNPAANKIEGMNGNDLIDGGSGSDVLSGGDGSDAFVFDTKLSASSNVDVITDYEAGIDAIALDKAIFTALSGLDFMSSGQFSWNANGIATDSSDRIIYDSTTGYLFYDADGSGGAASIHFATVSSNLRLTSTDFYIYE